MRKRLPGRDWNAATTSGDVERRFRRMQIRHRLHAAWQSTCVGFAGGGALCLAGLLSFSVIFSAAVNFWWVWGILLCCVFGGGLIGWRRSKRSPQEWARIFDDRRGLEGMDAWTAWWDSHSWPPPWGEAARRKLAPFLESGSGACGTVARPGRHEGMALLVLFVLVSAQVWHGMAQRENQQLLAVLEENAEGFWRELQEAEVPPGVIERWQEEWAQERQLSDLRNLPERWDWFSGVWREQAGLSPARQEAEPVSGRENPGLASSTPENPAPSSMAQTNPVLEDPANALESSGVPQLDFPVDSSPATATAQQTSTNPGRGEAGRPDPDNLSRQEAGANASGGTLSSTTADASAGDLGPDAADSKVQSAAKNSAQEAGGGRMELASGTETTEIGEGPVSPPSGGERPVASSTHIDGSLPGSPGVEPFPFGGGEQLSLPGSTLPGMGEIISVLSAAERWDGQSGTAEILRSVAREQAGGDAVASVSLLHRDKVRRYFLALEQAGRGPLRR